MAALRFAVIGCGRIANNHLEAIRDAPGAEPVAVCDSSPERAKGYADKFHVPLYTNYHTMLTRERIDAVAIVTPSGSHPAHAIDVMRRYRKHVVVEKPMAMAWGDLARMKAAAAEAGVKIFPIYQNRYNKAVRKVKQDVAGGSFGKLVLGTVRVRWCRPQRYYDLRSLARDMVHGRRRLTNQGIHFIDLLQHIVGDVESVSARIATQLVNVEVEDTAVATLKFVNGALGVIEVTTAARPDDIEASISILGEKGVATLSGIAANVLQTYTLDPAAVAAHSEQFPDAYGFGHWLQYRDIVADLAQGIPHPISFDEGTKAIRLLTAIYRSAEDGCEVRLDQGLASRRLGRPDPRLFGTYQTEPESC